MEVSVGVYETCVLLLFLFLTQITEQYLDVVTAGVGGERGGRGGDGTGFPIISDSDESPKQWGRHSLWLALERAVFIQYRLIDRGLFFVKYINKYFNLVFIGIYIVGWQHTS